tara:strand:- start:14779 stop:15123 length:345 start_codon:yes stop_codon:yes gene_type:complete
MNEINIRPWGKYEILLDQDNTKVKKITVNPGQKSSYQFHKKRDEYWIITKGELTIVLNNKKTTVKYGEFKFIPRESHHRAINNTNDFVEFIEVQTGLYFGEDDISRLQDDYGRS